MHCECGFSRVNITPPVGVDLTGYAARPGPSVGVHDELYAGAIAFRAEDSMALLVTSDLIGFGPALAQRIRERIAVETGIPLDAIALTGSHTHGGPATYPFRQLGEGDPDYLALLELKLAGAAAAALHDLQPARLQTARGATQIARNRRGHSDIVDPTLDMLWIEQIASAGRNALVYTTACHAVCYGGENLLVTGDWPGAATELLCRNLNEARAGRATEVFFANGCAGDQNPIHRGDEAGALRTGNIVAADALTLLQSPSDVEDGPVGAIYRRLDLPTVASPPTDELQARRDAWAVDLAAARAADPKSTTCKSLAAFCEWADATLAAIADGNYPSAIPVDLQAFRLGNVALVFLPAEPLVRLGLAIRELAPLHTMVLGYANGLIGYVADRESYSHGGYEVDVSCYYYGYGPWREDAGERMIEAAAELVRQL